VLKLLPSLSAELAASAAIQAIVTQLPDVSEHIGLDLEGMKAFLEGQPSLAMLAAREQVWNARQVQTTSWLNLLTQEVTKIQGEMGQLAELQKTWRATRAAAQAANAPVEILQQIDAVLAAIESTNLPFEARHTTVLGVQSRVAQEVARCGDALTLLALAQQRAMSGILARSSRPIWSAEQWEQVTSLPTRMRENLAGCWKDLIQYTQDTRLGMPWHVAVFAVLTLLMMMVRRQVRRWAAAGESVSPATAVFNRPYAIALFAPLLFISWPYSAAPVSLRDLARVLALLPALRLIRPAVGPLLAVALYVQVAVFALDSMRQANAGSLGPEQAMLAIEMLAGIAVLGYSVMAERWRRIVWVTERLRTLRMLAGFVLLVLVVGLAADVFGYLRLARLLASTVLGSGALAVTLYGSLRVLMGMAAVALRVWPLRLLRMVQHHRDLLERRTRTVMTWGVVIGWLTRTLDYVGLLQPALGLGATVLGARLQRGSMSISLGDVLDFILTLWVAYLISVFLRFLLEEDVYPNLRLPRGISYACSSLLNYAIVALGFMLGLAALGMDLTKLTVLAGALGVGIGFGLQNVVNNFISGLILLFERPIHVGDAIQSGDLTGQVRRIGIRASIVRTWDGADMIVPNAQLITDRVINWTLNDRLRRISLPVGVNYGAPPKKVIELLETVARAHPDVLQDPVPQGFFTGFGDSSLNFELRAWTDQFDKWFQIRSELATSVYEAGTAAGLSFPFPQREVRILPDAPRELLGPKDMRP